MPKAGARGHVAAPAAKKARVVKMDPLEKKVQELISAFESDQQVGLVEMSPVVRSMLISVMKCAIGKGAAKDERHSFQTSVADVIGEALKQTVKIWEDKMSEAKALVENADGAKAEKEVARSTAASALEELSAKVSAAEEAVATATESSATLRRELCEAQKAVDNGDAERQSKQEHQTRVASLFQDHFEVLKTGGGDKSLVKPLTVLLKDLKAEASLVNAMASTFAKKPDDRGQFDNMVIEQLEAVLKTHMAEIDKFLTNFEKISSERASAASEKKAALEAAEQQEAACEKTLQDAICAKVDGEAELKEAQTFLEEFDEKLSEKEVEVSMREGFLWQARENLKTFEYLYERVQAAPEATQESEAVSDTAMSGVDEQQAA